uniref:Secreted protein n=1 Tax=Anser cygnoides TaxID=8845 RepID=A0A8B9IGB0_ANSCY
MLLARVAVKLGAVLPILLPVLLLPVLSVGHVHDDQQRRTSDEDELQGPQADVGDGEEVVVADVGAARLPRVAVKVLLLIPPDALGSHHVDQHAEDKDHGEPDAAKGRGVLVDPADLAKSLPPAVPDYVCWYKLATKFPGMGQDK